MTVVSKDESINRIRETIAGMQGRGSVEAFEKLMLLVYHWLEDNELEEFAEFVEDCIELWINVGLKWENIPHNSEHE